MAAIAAFHQSLQRRHWIRWQPRLRVLVLDGGGERLPVMPPRAHAGSIPFDVMPVNQAEATLALFEPASAAIDVVACIEAPLLLTGDLEHVLNRVADEALVAGVVADRPFALLPGETAGEAWSRISNGVCERPPLTHTCLLLDPALPLALRTTPFAPDPSVVFVAATALDSISRHYAALVPRLNERLPEPRTRHRVALALAIAQTRTFTWALPLRYNVRATVAIAAERRELLDSAVMVNLAEWADAGDILQDPERYAAHLRTPRQGASAALREAIFRGLGPVHPCTDGSDAAAAADALACDAYRSAVAGHASSVAAPIATLQRSIDAAVLRPSAGIADLETMQVILASGLFDPGYYLSQYPDVAESGVDPLVHYVGCGEYQGRWPNPRFNPVFYRDRHLHGSTATNALGHYIEVGEAAGLGTQLFDPRRYLRHHPELAGCVDRPLFHFLKIGHGAGLAGAPSDEAARHLAHFQRTKDTSPGALMRYKQALVREFGVPEGFAVLRETLALPSSDRISLKPIRSQRDHARAHASVYVETDPGGEPVIIESSEIVGEGDTRRGTTISRAAYVACVGDAWVRGHSAFIDTGEALLFDFEGRELENFDSELEFDNAIFHAPSHREAWILEGTDPHRAPVLESAFSLLSARSHAFGHWVWESLPKFVAARLSGALPPMPILIDAEMSSSHRESLEWMLVPGDEVIEVPNFASLRVRQLWCAPTPQFATVFEKRNERFQWDYLMQSSERSAPILAEMGHRADLALGPVSVEQPERVYLARKIHRHSHHVLVNHAQIEDLARSRGFRVCYPEDLSFADQVRLVRNARFILAPEGSALFLMSWARAGARLCILNDARTVGFAYADMVVTTTMFTGPIVAEHDLYYEWADYEIDAGALEQFLDGWLVLDGEPDPSRAGGDADGDP